MCDGWCDGVWDGGFVPAHTDFEGHATRELNVAVRTDATKKL
jgi:hypothetical protein